MSILVYEVRLLDAEVCKELGVLAHVPSKFDCCWLVAYF